MRAIITMLLVILALTAEAGINQWTSGGPFGASVVSFSFHPKKNNIVFANTEIGPYRSIDSGKTWKRLEVFGIVGVHPKNPERLIAVSFSVFESFDQGDTWNQVSSDPFQTNVGFINRLVFDPENPSTLYALARGIGSTNGVFKSTDGGISFVRKSKGLPLEQGFQLVIDPKNRNTLYAAIGRKGIFKTTNGGDSWRPANKGLNPELSAFDIDRQNPQILYAASFDVFKTTNGGRNWFQISRLPGGGAIDLTVSSKDPSKLYAVGFSTNSAWKSIDHGVTWSVMKIDPDELQAVAVHPVFSTLVFAGGTRQGIFRSQNSGASWKSANRRVDASDVERISANSKRILASGSNKGILQSLNRGLNWKRLNFGVPDSIGSDAAVHSKNPDLIVAAGAFGRNTAVAISKDGGRQWEFPSPFSQAHFILLDPIDPGIIYIADSGDFSDLSGVAKSSDQGKSWQLMNSGLSDRRVSEFAIDPSKGSNLFVGTSSGKIFRSTNGGGTWKNRSKGIFGEKVMSIAVDPSDPNTAYAVVNSKLFKTTNGGSNWTQKEEGLNFGIASISVDAENPATVYAGAFGGLFISTDAAESFSSFDNTGLGSFVAFDLIRSPAQQNTFLLATQRGVFSFTRKIVAGAPVIDQIIPKTAKEGDAVRVRGRNFGASQEDSQVNFGNRSGDLLSWSDTEVEVRVPAGARNGSVILTVGGTKSNPFEFIVLPPSGSVYPISGRPQGGTSVTILAPPGFSGTQFGVLFGSSLATGVRFIEPNIITCETPAGGGMVEVALATNAASAPVGSFLYE